MEKFYAVSLAAQKNGQFIHVPATLVASSKDEATGKAYNACLNTFKVGDGYTNHSVSIMELDGIVVRE
jgi:hypothetical protein